MYAGIRLEMFIEEIDDLFQILRRAETGTAVAVAFDNYQSGLTPAALRASSRIRLCASGTMLSLSPCRMRKGAHPS